MKHIIGIFYNCYIQLFLTHYGLASASGFTQWGRFSPGCCLLALSKSSGIFHFSSMLCLLIFWFFFYLKDHFLSLLYSILVSPALSTINIKMLSLLISPSHLFSKFDCRHCARPGDTLPHRQALLRPAYSRMDWEARETKRKG